MRQVVLINDMTGADTSSLAQQVGESLGWNRREGDNLVVSSGKGFPLTLALSLEGNGPSPAFPCRHVIVERSDGLERVVAIIRDETSFLETLENVKEMVGTLFANDFSGHDVSHTLRVFANARMILSKEKAEWKTVALASLLHDADDHKLFHTVDYANARMIMEKCAIGKALQEKVVGAISTVSFSEGNRSAETIEGKIVQDADRLDAIGAIGIGRAFAYGGSHGRSLYVEGSQDSTIGHFLRQAVSPERPDADGRRPSPCGGKGQVPASLCRRVPPGIERKKISEWC